MIVTPLVPEVGMKKYSGVSSSTKAVSIRFATRVSKTPKSSDPWSRYAFDHGIVVSSFISILVFVAAITTSFAVVVVNTAVVLVDVVLATDVLAPVELVVDCGVLLVEISVVD